MSFQECRKLRQEEEQASNFASKSHCIFLLSMNMYRFNQQLPYYEQLKDKFFIYLYQMQWGGRKRLLNLVIVAPSEEFLINSSHKVEKICAAKPQPPPTSSLREMTMVRDGALHFLQLSGQRALIGNAHSMQLKAYTGPLQCSKLNNPQLQI